MGFWSSVGDGAYWVGDVIYSPISGYGYGISSAGSCMAYGVGLSDGERCLFDGRFAKQMCKGIEVIVHRNRSNPIEKIVTAIICHLAKKNRKKLEYALAKFEFKRRVKNKIRTVVLKPIIEEIVSVLIDYVMVSFLLTQAKKKALSSALSGGVLAVGAAINIVEESYKSAMRLKHKNHSIYLALYNANVECYWSLVEKKLENFVY